MFAIRLKYLGPVNQHILFNRKSQHFLAHSTWITPLLFSCRWRVLRDHDAFPGQDLGKVPISQLSDAKVVL